MASYAVFFSRVSTSNRYWPAFSLMLTASRSKLRRQKPSCNYREPAFRITTGGLSMIGPDPATPLNSADISPIVVGQAGPIVEWNQP